MTVSQKTFWQQLGDARAYRTGGLVSRLLEQGHVFHPYLPEHLSVPEAAVRQVPIESGCIQALHEALRTSPSSTIPWQEVGRAMLERRTQEDEEWVAAQEMRWNMLFEHVLDRGGGPQTPEECTRWLAQLEQTGGDGATAWLLRHGADPNGASLIPGLTCFQAEWAKQGFMLDEYVQPWTQAGADWGARTEDGRTLVHLLLEAPSLLPVLAISGALTLESQTPAPDWLAVDAQGRCAVDAFLAYAESGFDVMNSTKKAAGQDLRRRLRALQQARNEMRELDERLAPTERRAGARL